MQTANLSRIEQLVELYYQPMFRFAARLCGGLVRAMTLTQRTFRLALDRSRDLPVPANARAWLFTLTFHNFLAARPRSQAHNRKCLLPTRRVEG
jgi:DNA-directed RNA polymerase specialized sigma24 family protein